MKYSSLLLLLMGVLYACGSQQNNVNEDTNQDTNQKTVSTYAESKEIKSIFYFVDENNEPIEDFKATIIQVSTIESTPEISPETELLLTNKKGKTSYNAPYNGRYSLKYYDKSGEEIFIDEVIMILEEKENVFEIVIRE